MSHRGSHIQLVHRGKVVDPDSRAGRKVMRRARRVIELLRTVGVQGDVRVSLRGVQMVRCEVRGTQRPWRLDMVVGPHGYVRHSQKARLSVDGIEWTAHLQPGIPPCPRTNPVVSQKIIRNALIGVLFPSTLEETVDGFTDVKWPPLWEQIGTGYFPVFVPVLVTVDERQYVLGLNEHLGVVSAARVGVREGMILALAGPMNQHMSMHVLKQVDGEQLTQAFRAMEDTLVFYAANTAR